MKLASAVLLFVFDWKGESTESTAARLLDKVGVAGSLTGHAGAEPWPARVLVVVRFFAGRRTRGRGWGK